MGSAYDPDAGILRLRHAALSVLARLAVDPTDPSLRDHDVAPLVAELRTLRILTERGIDPPVAPLAEAVGGASSTFTIEVDDHDELRRYRGWLGQALGVVAEQVAGTDDHELMADVPAMVPSLLADLVGLGTAPEPAVSGDQLADADALAAVLARGTAATLADVTAALGRAEPTWAQALTDAVRGAALRWRLRSWATGAGHGGGYGGEHAGEHWEGRWMEVLDAGRAGLWLLEPGDEGRTRVSPSTVPAMRARIAAVLD